jgi:hypothetical protein
MIELDELRSFTDRRDLDRARTYSWVTLEHPNVLRTRALTAPAQSRCYRLGLTPNRGCFHLRSAVAIRLP